MAQVPFLYHNLQDVVFYSFDAAVILPAIAPVGKKEKLFQKINSPTKKLLWPGLQHDFIATGRKVWIEREFIKLELFILP
ncbi:hypothetical protein P378_02430 [Desulforamulus profundi]|uniref:Uncharacterized protein n=1 Tax=Desulforamulus profundi TaxID=1383067 RepID=A0A2C6L483_9FIRM|nr:hypothetical protein P378_02430 [Desulforamulus profundi]